MRRNHERYPPNSKIFIGNFDNNIPLIQLQNIFSKYGRIVEIPTIKKGFAFIQYPDEYCAQRAIQQTDGIQIGAKTVQVQYAKNSSYKGGLGKRVRDDHQTSMKKMKLDDDLIKVPLFVFERKLLGYANKIQVILRSMKINSDIHFVTKEFLKTIPNEKYLLYLFPRNEQDETIYFCAILGDGSSPGFIDTPAKDVAIFIKKDVTKSKIPTGNLSMPNVPSMNNLPNMNLGSNPNIPNMGLGLNFGMQQFQNRIQPPQFVPQMQMFNQPQRVPSVFNQPQPQPGNLLNLSQPQDYGKNLPQQQYNIPYQNMNVGTSNFRPKYA